MLCDQLEYSFSPVFMLTLPFFAKQKVKKKKIQNLNFECNL